MDKAVNQVDIEAVLHGNLHRILSKTYVEQRAAAIAELWTAAPTMFEADGILHGRKAISDKVSALLQMLPSGTTFAPAGPVSGHHDLYVCPWQASQPGQPPHTFGRDIVLIRDGAIDRLWAFVEQHP